MNRGFTIVELLAAMALSLTLMVAILQMVAAVRLDPKLAQRMDHDVQSQRLVDLVTWDLTHARTMVKNGSEITLIGYGSLSAQDLAAGSQILDSDVHQPVTVQYILRQDGHRSYLVRRQTPLGQLSDSHRWTEMVDCNIRRFDIEAADGAGLAETESNNVPSSVRLMVERMDGDVKRIDRVIILR